MYKLSIKEYKCTFKGVQSCALANRTFDVVKLVFKLCVDVVGRVSCNNPKNIQEKNVFCYTFRFKQI